MNKEYIKKFRRTQKGLTSGIYSNQKVNAKQRNHNLPNYSLKQFSKWIKSQPFFDYLFKCWVESNYNTKLIPSVDRIDNNLSYTLDNIQLMTWSEHHNKTMKDIKNGIITHGNKPQKAVIQLDINNNYINEFVSVKQASRETNINSASISLCCNGLKNDAKGYKFKFQSNER